MTTRSLQSLIHYLRRCVPHPDDATRTDAQLLERWTHERDCAAFELLLWRHGPMVLNTCRRLLHHGPDAEDAFQATFLVLLRKANSIRRGVALPAWLHRVACRVALRARGTRLQHYRREQPLRDQQVALPHDDATSDLRAVVDEEIDRLPSHYRRALILCCLEGKSQEEAARLLACPRGTLSSWLTRGRERLRQRLLRRGIAVSATALTTAFASETMASGGLSLLIGALVRVAAGAVAPSGVISSCSVALAERTLQAMFVTKMKVATSILLGCAALAVGIGTVSRSTRAEPPLVLQKEDKNALNRRAHVDFNEWTAGLRMKTDETVIAWGEKANGLQAGIGMRPGDQEIYEIGQSVTFVVYLRNVSDKEIRVSHVEPLFAEWMPIVKDANGIRLAVASGPIKLGVVPIEQRTLKAGQQITFGYPWFRLRPLDWQGDVVGPTCCVAPGKFTVSFTGLPLRLDDDKKDVNGPTTGGVEFDVRKKEEAKEERPRKTASASVSWKVNGITVKALPVVLDTGGKKDSPRLFYYPARSFDIPFRVRPECQIELTTLILLVSWDKGENWKLVDQRQHEEKKFHFNAPQDGEYWFSVQEDQAVLRGRVLQPSDTSNVKPMLRIRVDTTPPVAEFMVSQKNPGEFLFTWTASDSNLEEKPITLEWAEKKDGPWKLLSPDPLPNKGEGTFKLPPEAPPRVYLRLRVKDKAGNEAVAVTYS